MKRSTQDNKKQTSGFDKDGLLKDLSEEEIRTLIDILEEKGDKVKPYYRNLDVIESHAISVDAYGYMLSMYNIGSLNEISFEKVIQICLHLYYITQEQVTKKKLDKIITMINFSDFNQANIKEFIDTLINDNKYQMNAQKIKH